MSPNRQQLSASSSNLLNEYEDPANTCKTAEYIREKLISFVPIYSYSSHLDKGQASHCPTTKFQIMHPPALEPYLLYGVSVKKSPPILPSSSANVQYCYRSYCCARKGLKYMCQLLYIRRSSYLPNLMTSEAFCVGLKVPTWRFRGFVCFPLSFGMVGGEMLSRTSCLNSLLLFGLAAEF